MKKIILFESKNHLYGRWIWENYDANCPICPECNNLLSYKDGNSFDKWYSFLLENNTGEFQEVKCLTCKLSGKINRSKDKTGVYLYMERGYAV